MKNRMVKMIGVGITLVIALALVTGLALPAAASPGETINEWYTFDYPVEGEDGDWFYDPSIKSVGPMAEAINGDLYAAITTDPGTVAYLGASGDGRASWSDEEASSGDYSALLDVSTMPLDGDTAWVTIPLSTPIAIEDLASFSYWVYGTLGQPAYAKLYIDVNGDGVWTWPEDDYLTLEPWHWPDTYEAKAWGGASNFADGIESSETNNNPWALPWYPAGSIRGMPNWLVMQTTPQWLQIQLASSTVLMSGAAMDLCFGTGPPRWYGRYSATLELLAKCFN